MKKLIILMMLLMLTPTAALAHIMPDHTDPAVGSTVSSSPKEVKIWFDGPVGVEKSKVDIFDAAGKSVVTGKLHGNDQDNKELIVPIAAEHGKFTVKWDAYCPDCEHTTHGTYTFTVEP
jgi:methionine-rich copper-binding protein CopC